MSIPSVLGATWKKVETRTPYTLSVFLPHPSKPSPLLPPIGYLLGGHVIRLFHGHDEVVAIPGSDQSEEEQRCEKQLTNKQGKFRLGVRALTPHLPGSSAVPVFIKKAPDR